MEMKFTDSRPFEPADSSRGLRPLGWSELCARLLAAHEMRGVLGGPNSGNFAGAPVPDVPRGCSFHYPAAVLLRNAEVETEAPVNPASSANGKDTEGTEGFVPNVAQLRRPDEICHD